MRILLTNNTLAGRAGSELYIRDLAVELMRRGHSPVAYSMTLGAVAEELRAATIPVIDSLGTMGEAPDIIHGQHHYEALTAMLWFPQTPAIYYCHGWLPWQEATLRFPRILHYVAVDELCRERLIVEGGIAPEQIDVIYNFFDPGLFPPRSPLPQVPRRSLAFGNEFAENNDLPMLREACQAAGIELDAIGTGSERSVCRTGNLLANYDIVFAKGRSAIEAMAVGAAVILSTPGRLGPLVTRRNFASLRRFNFGVRTLSSPMRMDLLQAELSGYDAEDGDALSRIVRELCPLSPAVDRLVSIYERVIATARTSPLLPSYEADRAISQYLTHCAPRYKTGAQTAWQLEERDLRIEGMIREKEQSHRQCEALEQTLLSRQADGELILAENRRLQQELERTAVIQRAEAEQLGLAQSQLLTAQEKVSALEHHLSSLYNSATWSWTQTLLRNKIVSQLLGPWIRGVAKSRGRSSIVPNRVSTKGPQRTL